MLQKNTFSGIRIVKPLYRSRKDKIIGGVCGGIAAYISTSGSNVRSVFLLIVLFFNFAAIVYLFLWIVIPLEPLEVVKEKEVLPGTFVMEKERIIPQPPLKNSQPLEVKQSGIVMLLAVILLSLLAFYIFTKLY